MVSIVIPTLNEEHTLHYLLHDLSTQTTLPDEIIVIDAHSVDKTKDSAKKFPRVSFYLDSPPVANQRTQGGLKAKGEIIFFLDADVRISPTFIENTLKEFTKRKLDIACPWYFPYKSTPPITVVYLFFSSIFFLFQKISPSGAGSAIITKKNLFQKIQFNSELRYDDIAFIRESSKSGRFGTLSQIVYVSDRRFKKYGVIRMTAIYLILSLFFLFNSFRLAHIIPYSFNMYKKTK